MSKQQRPVYNIKLITKLREKLLGEVFVELHGFAFSGEGFTRLVQRIHREMYKADYQALYNTLMPLADVGLLDTHLNELAWRLSGNVHHLAEGRAVPVWQSQPFPEWVPVQVISVVPAVKKYKFVEKPESVLGSDIAKTKVYERPAVLVTLLVLAGLAAGHQIVRKWSTTYCYRIAPILGFSRFNRAAYGKDPGKYPNRPLTDPLELTRMRFLVLLTPETCLKQGKGTPNFEQLSCSSGLRKWNQWLWDLRQRNGALLDKKPFACPYDYQVGPNPCHRCWVGYDKCKAACHPRSFMMRLCHRCDKQALFDPALGSPDCIECTNRPRQEKQ